MADQRIPAVKFMSPLGTFVWPNLNTPDTKFKPQGEYTARLRVSAEDGEAFLKKIRPELAKALAKAKEELTQKLADAKTGADKGKAKKALDALQSAGDPVKPVFDEDGNETGEMEFNFKMAASGVYKSGPKKGTSWTKRPDIFDAKGKLLKNPPNIWGGSTGYVAGEVNPYYAPNDGKAGISLRMNAVQLVTLQSGSGARDASAFGFGAVEGGFEADEDQLNGEASMPDRSGGGEEGEASGVEHF